MLCNGIEKVTDAFFAIRDEFWAKDMRVGGRRQWLPTAKADARHWLEAGLSADQIVEILRFAMGRLADRDKTAPSRIAAFQYQLNDAAKGYRVLPQSALSAGQEYEFLDSQLEELQLAWSKSYDDPERRAKLKKAIDAREDELKAGA